MTDTVYIYSLDDPTTGEPKYIGKTNNVERRFKQHINRLPGWCEKDQWVESVFLARKEPIISIIDETTRENGAFLEHFYITLFVSWGFSLTNLQSNPRKVKIKNKTEEDLLQLIKPKRIKTKLLSKDIVKEFKERTGPKMVTMRNIAQRYKLSIGTIRAILDREGEWTPYIK